MIRKTAIISTALVAVALGLTGCLDRFEGDDFITLWEIVGIEAPL